jgi:LmbE family N-acetylglucosaminyl deacetylase
MKRVYLSPHLDDAVLSCGGAIHRQAQAGAEVLAITVFTGDFEGSDLSSFARSLHKEWGGLSHPFALRRAEDNAALTLLNAEGENLEHLDAIYRVAPDGEWLYPNVEAIFGEVHPADPLSLDGARGLAERVTQLLPPPDQALLYAPLGVGHHVDHQIIRTAAHTLLEAGYHVGFYEDYPYAETPGALEAALPRAGTGGWRIETIALEPENMAAKVSALGYHRSQLAMLFDGAEAMPNRVWSFAATRSPQACLAERIWWPEEA